MSTRPLAWAQSIDSFVTFAKSRTITIHPLDLVYVDFFVPRIKWCVEGLGSYSDDLIVAFAFLLVLSERLEPLDLLCEWLSHRQGLPLYKIPFLGPLFARLVYELSLIDVASRIDPAYPRMEYPTELTLRPIRKRLLAA